MQLSKISYERALPLYSPRHWHCSAGFPNALIPVRPSRTLANFLVPFWALLLQKLHYTWFYFQAGGEKFLWNTDMWLYSIWTLQLRIGVFTAMKAHNLKHWSQMPYIKVANNSTKWWKRHSGFHLSLNKFKVYFYIPAPLNTYSKTSPIQLQLIQIKIWNRLQFWNTVF